MNMNNRDRFVVLFNKQYAIDQAGGHQSAQMKHYKKMNLQTIFNSGSAGTVADITTGSVYLLIISDNAAGAVPTNFPDLSLYTRIRYEDA